MAEENIIFNTQINTGNSATSIKSVRAELRELTQQMAGMEVGSQAFVKAAQRAGELQDRMQDAQAAVKAFNPEAKFQAFAGVLGGVANGFAAAQGAMAIFGSDSKELEKVMQRTQGAIALATGVNGLLGLKDSFSLLKGQILDAVKGLFTLRGALIATGVGAFAVAIGTIIANWKAFSNAITEAFPGFQKVIDFFKNFRQIAVGSLKATVEGFKVIGDVVAKFFKGDFSEAIESAKQFGAKVADAYNVGYEAEDKKVKLENSLKQRKFEIELEEAKGKDVLKKKLQLQKDELQLLEKGSEEYNQKLIEIEQTRTKIREKAADLRKKKHEKELEEAKKAEEAFWKAWETKLTETTNGLNKELKNFVSEISDEFKRLQKENDDTEYFKKRALDTIANEKKSFQERKDVAKFFYDSGVLDKEAFDNAIIKLDEEKTKAQIQGLQSTSSALQGFAQLAGEQTAEGKALAIASTTIDTFVAAQSAYAAAAKIDPLILAPLAAAGAIAAGLARVKAITAVQVPKGGGGAPSIGGVAPAAPALPPPSSATRLTNGNEPIVTRELNVKENRVYVLEKDITKKQDDVAGIVNKATIQ